MKHYIFGTLLYSGIINTYLFLENSLTWNLSAGILSMIAAVLLLMGDE